MLHLFLDKGDWFAAKRYGMGSGWPIKWQGWALFVAHITLVIGCVVGFSKQPVLMIPLIFIAAILPLPIYKARTRGGWKWRWGDED